MKFFAIRPLMLAVFLVSASLIGACTHVPFPFDFPAGGGHDGGDGGAGGGGDAPGN
jgi:hypothetical protein